MISLILITVVSLVVFLLMTVRKRQYKYNPAQDYVYDFETKANGIHTSKIHNNSLQLFEKQEGETLILENEHSHSIFRSFISAVCGDHFRKWEKRTELFGT